MQMLCGISVDEKILKQIPFCCDTVLLHIVKMKTPREVNNLQLCNCQRGSWGHA